MPSSMRSRRLTRACCFQRLRQRAVVFSRVVALARRRRVGERRRRDEVLAADLLGLLAELLRDDVDQPFEVVRGLRPSRAAIRGHRRRVGEHAGRLEVDVGELVDADAHHQREVGDEGEDRIGADVRHHVHAHGGDGAVRLDGRLEVGHLRAPVGGGHHVLDARLRPAQRQLVEARARGERGVLRIRAELHAEAAADLGRDHAHEVLRHAQHGGEVVAQHVRRLVARPHRDAARRRIGRGQRRAWLHRDAGQALADHPLLDDLVGLLEGGVGIALLDLGGVLDVAGRVLVQLGRAPGHRGGEVADGRQRIPVDDDLLRAVHRRRFGGRDDRGHRLADVAHAADGEREVLAPGLGLRPAAALGTRPAERKLLHVGAQILARHHSHDAGPLEGGLRVDLAHARVGVRAAHEHDVMQSGHRDVADVGGGAGHEPGIFLALHFRAHQSGGCRGHVDPFVGVRVGG